MNRAIETLWLALDSGLQLWVDGDQLRFRSATGALTDELKARLKAHKTELLDLIGPGRKLCLPALAQQRLWFLQQLDPHSPAYNLPAVSRLQGQLDAHALARALARIVERHESLRTVFVLLDGRVAQSVVTARTSVPVVDLSRLPPALVERLAQELASREVQSAFDLASGPLVHFRLFRLGPEDHALVINIHHSVYDGWSVGLLFGELVALYNFEVDGRGEPAVPPGVPPVPDLPLQYADYALWQREQLQGALLERLLDYWRERLPRVPSALDLPGQLTLRRNPVARNDDGSPRDAGFLGDEVLFSFPGDVRDRLETLARQRGTSLPVVLLAGFQTLLHAYTGAPAVTLGQPTANRTRREVEALIGFFANIVVLHTDLRGDPSFDELLTRAQITARGAGAHQELPFDRLVEELAPERDPARRNPLFQIFFAVQNAPRGEARLRGLTLQPLPFAARVTRFDLEVHLTPAPDSASGGSGSRSSSGILCHVIYSTALLERTAVERLPRHLLRILEQAVERPARHLGGFQLLTRAETRQLLDWTTTGAHGPATEQALLGAFNAHVAAGPEAAALVGDHGSILATRREVQDAATREAQEQGNNPLQALLDVGGLPALLEAANPHLRLLGPTGQPAPIGVWASIDVCLPRAGEMTPVPSRAFQGRWRSNGGIELRPAGSPVGSRPAGTVDAHRLWRQGALVDTRVIERRLLDLRFGETGLSGAAVRARRVFSNPARACDRGENDSELVAWVTASVSLAPERLDAVMRETFLARQVDPRWIPQAIVQVSLLPLTQDGQLDERALQRVEVPTPDILQRWRTRLRALPEVRDVEVVSIQVPRTLDRYHRDDLVPPGEGVSPAATDTTTRTAAREAAVLEIPPAETPPAEASSTVADGGPLELPAEAPRTLGEALLRTAREHAEHGIAYIGADGSEDRQSYPQLLVEAQAILGGLRRDGLVAGDYVVLQFEDIRLHLTTFWACILGGLVPVTVAVPPSYEVDEAGEYNAVALKLLNTWRLLGHAAVLTQVSLAGALARLGLEPPIHAIVVDPFLERKPATPRTADSHDVAFLQLTSGSTGIPKCIQETHHGIAHHIEGSRLVNGNSARDITLNWLPLDHVVPMLTYHIKDVYLGCRQVQLAGARVFADPLCWLDALERHGVTHSWAPNFGFKLVADALAQASPSRSAQVWDLSRLQLLMNAGEQVTLPVVDDFLRRTAPFDVRPEVMQPAYGMAELCTAMTYANGFRPETGAFRCRKAGLGEALVAADTGDPLGVDFIDVGPPIPGVRLRVVNADSRPLPEGVVGRLQVAGAIVTPGYLNNEAANREAFPRTYEDDGVWFHTGDLAFLRGGHLTITGREKEVIIVRGANFYCYEIEDIVSSVDGVAATFSAACALEDPVTGTEGLAIFFVPESPDPEASHCRLDTTVSRRVARLADAVQAAVTERLGISPSVVLPLAPEDFPKTTSGKIQRTRLKEALETGEFDELRRRLDLQVDALAGPLGTERTVPAWFHQRVWRRCPLSAKPRRNREIRVRMLVPRDASGSAESTRLAAVVREQLQQQEATVDGYQLPATAELAQALQPGDTLIYLGAWNATPRVETAEDLTRLQEVWVRDVLELVSSLQTVPPERRRGLHLLVPTASSHHVGPATGDPSVGTASDEAESARGSQAREPQGRNGWVYAGVSSVFKTWSQEQPWLQARHLDLPATASHLELARHLVAEVAAQHGAGAVSAATLEDVAWRDGTRYVTRLRPLRMKPPAAESSAVEIFSRRSRWLLTGGLGGIGRRLAAWLLRERGARLLLTGRRSAQDSDIVRELQALATLGDVTYVSCDVTDGAALETAVARAEKAWGATLSGAVHLAGSYHEALLSDESVEGFLRPWRSKVLGGWQLRQLLAARPESQLIAFSSVNGSLGGRGVAAYGAANAGLEGLCAMPCRDGPRVHTLAWSLWQDVGMSQGFAAGEAARARGFLPVSAPAGLLSLQAVLGRMGPQDASRQEASALLVGLDDRQPHVRQILELPGSEPKDLRAWQLAAAMVIEGGVQPRLDDFALRDRFGTPAPCSTHEVDTLPRGTDGGVDTPTLRRRLQQLVTGRTTVDRHVAPRSDLEARLAELWQELLGGASPSVRDNFFRLGGHSLLASRLVLEIERRLDTQLPVSALFQAPTIERLARIIEAQERGAGGRAWSPLVPLQPEGDRTPFFCVAPIMGTVFPYFELAQLLGPGALDRRRPFVGVQPLGLATGQTALATIEEITEYFLTEIRALQPTGPYFLGGWSFGSFVVYELTRRLRQQGEEIALAALIDTPAPLPSQRPSFLHGLRFLFATLLRNFWPWVKDYFALQRTGDFGDEKDSRGLWQRLLERATLAEVIPEESREVMSHQPQIRAMLRAMRANSEAMGRYQPRAADVRVLLLRTEHSWSRSEDETLGWSELALGGVEVERLPGNHMTLLRKPHVETVARVLARYL